MNRPWMPLYIADYLRDTAHLRAVESGAYLHLIMAYWISGKLPNDDRQLATIAKLTDEEWQIAKPTLAAFFGSDWSSHKRIDKELRKSAKVSATRRRAAKQKWSKQDANASAYADTLHTSQSEDKTAQGAGGVGDEDGKYAFLGGIIKLSPKHFASWVKAYPQLDLRGELTARDAWLGSDRAQDADRRNWFVITSKYLANRNTEMKAKADAQRPVQQRGIAGII